MFRGFIVKRLLVLTFKTHKCILYLSTRSYHLCIKHCSVHHFRIIFIFVCFTFIYIVFFIAFFTTFFITYLYPFVTQEHLCLWENSGSYTIGFSQEKLEFKPNSSGVQCKGIEAFLSRNDVQGFEGTCRPFVRHIKCRNNRTYCLGVYKYEQNCSSPFLFFHQTLK